MSRYSGDDASVVSAGSIRNTRNLCFNDTESSPGNLEQTMDLSDQFSQSQGQPPLPSGQAKVNSRHALRDSGPGARHGYHGVRLPEAPRSVRLYGSAPCMRSSVDEIVFNRDMDLSGGGMSPEMDHLIKCFEGGAGQKDAMADLMGYVRHSEKQRNVRMYGVAGGVGASQLDEVIFGRDMDMDQGEYKDIDWFSHAGCKTREKDLYGRKKKLWPEGPVQSKHGAAEVVFGKEKEHLTYQDQKVIDEHYTNAAGTSLHFGRTEGTGLKRPDETWKTGGKRVFENTPMNKSVMNRVIHQSPVHENEDQRLSKLYEGAAGTSVRYNRNKGCIIADGSHTEGVVAIHH